jgi:hypothetical protein
LKSGFSSILFTFGAKAQPRSTFVKKDGPFYLSKGFKKDKSAFEDPKAKTLSSQKPTFIVISGLGKTTTIRYSGPPWD